MVRDMDDSQDKKDTKKKLKKPNREEERERRIKELEEQLARAVADYRNLEKRVEEEKRETMRFANRELLLQLLPAFDTLFLAEKHIEDEGLALSIKKLTEVLRNAGVEKIETEGREFDPHFMEVVDTEEGEENKVLEELRPGFTLYGKVLSPSYVRVGKKQRESKDESEAREELLKGDYM